jgi:hypothetical protein
MTSNPALPLPRVGGEGWGEGECTLVGVFQNDRPG